MRTRLLFVFAWTLLAAAFWWVFLADPGRIPLLDFNRNVLAETYQEGYCAGEVFWTSNRMGSAAQAKACRAEHADLPSDVDHPIVLRAFCEGFMKVSEWQADINTECIDVLLNMRVWPTLTGRLSDAFEDPDYPYPGDRLLDAPPSDSRTGQRDGFSRDDKPSSTTTTTASTTTEGDG